MKADRRRLAPALALCLLIACGRDEPIPTTSNVLLLIADDLGTDKLSAYAEHPDPPATPTLDALAANGVLFRNAYAPPACSPSRAAMLTGRLPRRYGLGIPVHREDAFELPLGEVTIPEMLASSPHGYSNSAVGKWHLAGQSSPTRDLHPLESGFSWYAGAFGNFRETDFDGEDTYVHWQKNRNGEIGLEETYATTDTVDDALARIEAMPEPWFLWTAFNAPHYPLHQPPSDLYDGRPLDTAADAYAAAVEALDTELGRLLDSMDPDVLARTTVIVVGDNGTPKAVVTPPRDPEHAKLTLREGGVNVPLIIAGSGVGNRGSETDALVHVVDIFSTVAEIAEVDPAQLVRPDGSPLPIDGRSLLPQLRDPTAPGHDFVYQDLFAPNGPGPYRRDQRMLRDTRWKLIVKPGGTEELFDLEGRSDDGPDQLPDANADLRAVADRLRAEMSRTADELDADRAGS